MRPGLRPLGYEPCGYEPCDDEPYRQPSSPGEPVIPLSTSLRNCSLGGRLTPILLLAGIASLLVLMTRPVTTILVVASAEPQSTPRQDPPLSVVGLDRAWALARTGQDANIMTLHVASSRAARQTAQPLASILDVPMGDLPVLPADRLVGTILDQHRGTTLLLVVEPSDLPSILVAMGVRPNPAIQSDRRDGLYVVTRPLLGTVEVLRLRYGPPSNRPDAVRHTGPVTADQSIGE